MYFILIDKYILKIIKKDRDKFEILACALELNIGGILPSNAMRDVFNRKTFEVIFESC